MEDTSSGPAQAELAPLDPFVAINARMEKNRTPLSGLNESEIEFLEVCLTIHRNYHGCATPGEEMISQLVTYYGIHGRLEPSFATDLCETFERDLDETLASARFIVKQYSERPAA